MKPLIKRKFPTTFGFTEEQWEMYRVIDFYHGVYVPFEGWPVVEELITLGKIKWSPKEGDNDVCKYAEVI